MPRSAKSFITRTHLPSSQSSKWRGISSRKQNTRLSTLQSKPTVFLVQRGVFPPLPSYLSAPRGKQGPLALGLALRTARWKDYADDKAQSHRAVAIQPRIMLCEWLTAKTQGDRVTGKGRHLFIYFPPWVTNS